jgi:hypothetical protein
MYFRSLALISFLLLIQYSATETTDFSGFDLASNNNSARNTYKNGTILFNITDSTSNNKSSNASVTILPSNNTGMAGSTGSGKKFNSSSSTNTTGFFKVPNNNNSVMDTKFLDAAGSDDTLNNNTSRQ